MKYRVSKDIKVIENKIINIKNGDQFELDSNYLFKEYPVCSASGSVTVFVENKNHSNSIQVGNTL